MRNIIKIALVDDQALFRDGFVALNDRVKAFDILFQAENGQECIEKLKHKKPQLILLDLDMPIMDGLTTAAYLKTNNPEIKIIMLTGHNEESLIRKAVDKGAHGFLDKDSKIGEIKDAAIAVLEQGYFFTEMVSNALIKKMVREKMVQPKFTTIAELTDKELEVLKLSADELSVNEIADKLFLTTAAIKWHRANIITKTNSKNIIGAIMYAVKNNLLD